MCIYKTVLGCNFSHQSRKGSWHLQKCVSNDRSARAVGIKDLGVAFDKLRIDSIGLLVVDEIHMIGESGSRGAVLEISLTKVMHGSADTPVIGMSAMLTNIAHLQSFLDADVYINDFRPVALQEFVKIDVYQVAPGAGAVEERFVHSRVCDFQYDREKTKFIFKTVLGCNFSHQSRKGNWRLQKCVSNDRSARAVGIKDLGVAFDKLSLERALGIQWWLESDNSSSESS